jgi:hypothetical protein
MIHAAKLATALQKLRDEREYAWVNIYREYGGHPSPLDTPLAALLEAVAKPISNLPGVRPHCRVCMAYSDHGHSDTCSFIAMLDAINGYK